MSVLIKGMEMPKHCIDCPLKNDEDDCTVQELQHWKDWDSMKAGCPLINVPTPHGRLIDEDNVIDAIHERLHVLQTHSEFNKKHADIDLLGVMPYIAKIQSVIEAEDE